MFTYTNIINKMKIAVLFSGRIQKYKEHYENICFAIGQNHEVDFFLSHSPECVEDLTDFIKIYKPQKVNNKPIQYIDVSNYTCHQESNSHNMMCMWFNRKRVFDDMRKYMCKNNIWYDLVISTRLDLWCYQLLDYSQIHPSILTSKDIYIPEGHDWGGVNDQMAIGNYYAMEQYMTLYRNILPILDNLMITNGTYGPEPVLLTHLNMMGMNIHRFKLDYRLINGKMYDNP